MPRNRVEEPPAGARRGRAGVPGDEDDFTPGGSGSDSNDAADAAPKARATPAAKPPAKHAVKPAQKAPTKAVAAVIGAAVEIAAARRLQMSTPARETATAPCAQESATPFERPQTAEDVDKLRAIADKFPTLAELVPVATLTDDARPFYEGKGYTHVLRCLQCVAQKQPKVYRASKTQFAFIVKHFDNHKQVMATMKTVSHADISQQLTMDLHLAVKFGNTFKELDEKAACAIDGSIRPTSEMLRTLAAKTEAAVLQKINSSKYTCLAFDGGMWTHGPSRGAHILVVVAHSEKGSFVLPPITQLAAWTGTSIGIELENLKAQLHGTKLKHFVVDGATANTAAIDGLNTLADFFAAFDEDVVICQDLSPDARELVTQMGIQLRGHQWVQVMHLLCMGHYVKNRIIDVQKKWAAGAGALAAQMVLQVSQSLFSPGCAAARKFRLEDCVREAKKAVKAHSCAGLHEVAKDIESLFSTVNSPSPMPSHAWRTRIVHDILALNLANFTPGTMSATLGAPGEGHWQEGFKELLARIQEEHVTRSAQSTAAHLATVNQTRWHTSTFLAFVFALENLDTLRKFYANESNGTAPPICDALGDEKRKQVEEQLEAYVSSLAPAAKFLERISESRAGQSLKMFGFLTLMLQELEAMPAGSPGRLLHALIKQEIFASTEPRPMPLVKTAKFFFFAQFLTPGFARNCGDEWFEQRQRAIDAKEFREGLGFTAAELPEEEFDEYWRVAQTAMRMVEAHEVEGWWRSRTDKFPRLSEVALYIFHTPCVVTSCDTAISILGSMFSKQQNRLDAKTAASLIALRCNGDVAEELPPGKWRRSFG